MEKGNEILFPPTQGVNTNWIPTWAMQYCCWTQKNKKCASCQIVFTRKKIDWSDTENRIGSKGIFWNYIPSKSFLNNAKL